MHDLTHPYAHTLGLDPASAGLRCPAVRIFFVRIFGYRTEYYFMSENIGHRICRFINIFGQPDFGLMEMYKLIFVGQ